MPLPGLSGTGNLLQRLVGMAQARWFHLPRSVYRVSLLLSKLERTHESPYQEA